MMQAALNRERKDRASQPIKILNEISERMLLQSRGAIGAITPPKTYERNFIHQDFVQFGKKRSRYKAILPSIVLSQKCCEVYFISFTVVNP